MSKAETKRFIESTFRVLDTIYQSDRDWRTYLRQIETEERDHRRHCPVPSRWLTVPLAVKYHGVMRIARAVREYHPPREGIFSLNLSLYMADVLAERKTIELSEISVSALLNEYHDTLNYADLTRL